MKYKIIDGGVCAPIGFLASGLHSGFKRVKKDLALIYSEVPCKTAGMFTKNIIKAAPVYITKDHVKNGIAQAIICNSGNANCCQFDDGITKAKNTAIHLAKALNIPEDYVLVSSTGIIGKSLDFSLIENNIDNLIDKLSSTGSNDAANSILTTDKFTKEYSMEFFIDNKIIKIGAIAKGSGMVNPNMGTILSFITTDLAISSSLLNEALKEAVNSSYNKISIDGDTSTNDMVLILANGLAKNKEITSKNEDYYIFLEALKKLSIHLAKEIARDGDGATKLIECTIKHAANEEAATIFANGIINSNTIKASLFNNKIDFGRILCALTNSNIDFNINNLNITLTNSKEDSLSICSCGNLNKLDTEKVKSILNDNEIKLIIDINEGNSNVTVWGSDLTYEYIRVTGDYRNLKGGR